MFAICGSFRIEVIPVGGEQWEGYYLHNTFHPDIYVQNLYLKIRIVNELTGSRSLIFLSFSRLTVTKWSLQ